MSNQMPQHEMVQEATDTSCPGRLHWALADDLYSSASTRGLYNPLHFVVRLRREFSDILKAGPNGLIALGHADLDLLSAFSTYFHETVHWWQHIGSTTGLMLSLVYPAQAHVNHRHLLQVVRDVGPRKSLKTLASTRYDNVPAATRKHLNIILNNWHDLEFNRRLILDPTRVDAVVGSPFFDCVGHSAEMGLSHMIWLLGATFDHTFAFLPDIRRWEDEFDQLRKARVDGFYYGSPVKLVPLGARHIFEGQARFSQLQYLHLATGGALGWTEFNRMGMLGGVYTTAFDAFLKVSGLVRPDTPVHPTVCLFLLVCDLAINPCDGFPFDIMDFRSFIQSNDPGFRFVWFSHQIADRPKLQYAVKDCTRAEFLEVGTELCRSIGCWQPVEMAQRIEQWVDKEQSLKSLLHEDETFGFARQNLPVRICFAKYLRVAHDRARRPEFFCWPAMHFVSRPVAGLDLDDSMEMFHRHSPLFMADIDGEIRPALVRGREEPKVYQAFNDFYYANVLYDMVRQWTVTDGPFDYDYSWLTRNYTAQEVKPWADSHFESVFGVLPDSFQAS